MLRFPSPHLYHKICPMTYLFLFAHPDDETIACAGTMKQLIDAGEEVILVSATKGEAGEVVTAEAKKQLAKFGSVAALRQYELEQVSQLLNVSKLKFLDFEDGEITNKTVWGPLTNAFIELFDSYKPDVVVTFDHSGWYYHLDHVGVSIAATLAYQKAKHVPDVFLLSYLQVEGSKWKYFYPEKLPITHRVDATGQRDLKLQALDLHNSQDTKTVEAKIARETPHYEVYQLAAASAAGQKLMENSRIFQKVTEK